MEKLLTPQELATILGISVQTLYNRRSYGGDLPPAVHIGRMVRYRPSEVDVWIRSLAWHPAEIENHELVSCDEKTIRRGRPTKAKQVHQRRRHR